MSNDTVIDASALVLALVGKTDGAERLRRGLAEKRLHAPHLVDAEVGNVLRRHERARLISSREADTAMWAASALVTHRYPHTGEVARLAWSLRHNLSYNDALYVALAGQLGFVLVTSDVRLSKAPGLPCEVAVP